jgi:hypothetical protein
MGLHKHICSLGMLIKCMTIVTADTNSEKMSAICIHFCRLIACEMSDKIFNSGS